MHDLSWFQSRKNKDVIRIYNGLETRVTIQGEHGDKFVEYFYGLQQDGYSFKDTPETIAAQSYDFDLPEVEQKKSGKPRISVSSSVCTSCEG